MAVFTRLTLAQAQSLFTKHAIVKLTPIEDGVSDTTYKVATSSSTYFLKHYETQNSASIEAKLQLIDYLALKGIRVAKLEVQNKGWYLFSEVKGKDLELKTLHQVQHFAKALALFHNVLHSYKPNLIHGDLFADNIRQDGTHIGFIDFSEAFEGSYTFDSGVALMQHIIGYKTLSIMKLRCFVQSYNQHARYKLSVAKLMDGMKQGALFYAKQRKKANRSNYKELETYYKSIQCYEAKHKTIHFVTKR